MEAQQLGFDEVLFQNEQGSVTEGAISNLFARIRGEVITPDVSCGLLPGVERASILASSEAKIGLINLPDLFDADEIFLCNALRGSRPVSMISDLHGELLWRHQRSCCCQVDLSWLLPSRSVSLEP